MAEPAEKMNFRAKKAGIGLQVQKKLEEGYDREESLGTPKRLVTWINSVLDGSQPACPNSSWKEMHFYLRDGVALCKLVNKLLGAANLGVVKFNSHNSSTTFVAMENIETFGKGAQKYGLPVTDIFQSVDLYEGSKGPFLNVINCLNRLGVEANNKGFMPRYDPPPTPSAVY